MKDMLTETEAVARALGMQLQLEQALGPNDIDIAFSAMAREHAGAVIVLPSPMFVGEYRHIVDLAAMSRLPAMYGRQGVCGRGRTYVLRSEFGRT